jgi:hypothetical protein
MLGWGTPFMGLGDIDVPRVSGRRDVILHGGRMRGVVANACRRETPDSIAHPSKLKSR